MRVAFLVSLVTIILFTGCRSANTLTAYKSKFPLDIAKVGKVSFDMSSLYLKPSPSHVDINNTVSIRPLNLAELEQFSGKAIPAISKNAVEKAFQYEGVRYRRGGLSKKGIDCSGLVYSCYSAFGVSLPRTSLAMSKSVYNISREEARKGDLIFFKTNGRKSINHVGLVIESDENEIKFIHASIHSGVIISSTNEPYYSRSFAKIGRIPPRLLS